MENETANTNQGQAAESLFYRDGRPFTGKPQHDEKGKPYFSYIAKCSRCGGAGGSDKWKFTGWTCFECGGSGRGKEMIAKLYTAEQLTKLNAAQEKRNTKKAAARAEKQAAIEAERNARRDSFKVQYAELFTNAAALNDSFINEMVARCIDCAAISQAQIDLINNKIAERAQKEASAFVGTIGERRVFTCKLEKFFDWSRRDSFPKIYRYCHVMRDENNQVIKYVGSTILGGVEFKRYDAYSRDGYFDVDTNAVLKFKATIEKHEEYKGEKQTIVARPKLME